MPTFKKDNPPEEALPIDNGNGKLAKNVIIYTGNSSKQLICHIAQKNGNRLIEVDKPIVTKIYNQSVEWRGRAYPIVPERFTFDYKGIAHQWVDVNDCSVLTYNKDHEENCRRCGGKMTVDAREARALGRRGIFHNIWGLDNTHVMLMLILIIGAMAMAGFGFYSYNQDTMHKTQLESAKIEIARQSNVIEQYYNMTGITIGR